MIAVKKYRYIQNLWNYVEDVLNELENLFLSKKKNYNGVTVREYSAQTGNVSIFIRLESGEKNKVEYSAAISSMLKNLGLKICHTKIKIEFHEKQKNKKIDTDESLKLFELFLRKFKSKTFLAGG